jgi:hypothetical protein
MQGGKSTMSSEAGQPQTREQRRKALNRMSKRDLAAMCRDGVLAPDGSTCVIEGGYPVTEWRKDEIVASILRVEYPEPAVQR